MLRLLRKSKWDVKVNAIREVKDLAGITQDELVGNFKTYEIQIDEAKMEKEGPGKLLALKAFKSDEEVELTKE